MEIRFKKVLVLAPHTDDGELGCGGTISKFIQGGAEVFYAAFSSCAQSVPQGFPSDILEHELRAATAVLGINSQNLFLLDFEVRKFSTFRQEILDSLLTLKKNIKPDLVFLPCKNDIHQDHIVITNEGIRAFKECSILGYELPWNNLSFNSNCFIKLAENHMMAKVESLAKYSSQANRLYTKEDFIKSLAKVRGIQAGSIYAEAFEVIRISI